ncbi:hypothetical protein [Paenibacillus sp.]|uniref:hypothetical protein n=1 Tax=Paenibacillus sp. TaxID=58172 RepID=UPI002D3E3ED0|nr:hypothetical protein [Paenibacillus sp.]HZG85233.1 hypothetical protein [Paenibacillus sp.]
MVTAGAVRRWTRAAALALALVLLSGCMYRAEIERQTANPAFIREELDRVAGAVKRYYEARSVYPIANANESTPMYEKYVIDLNRLVQAGMLSGVPRNAFEAGGNYYYLLIRPETEPEPVVMLMDIAAVQAVAELQRQIDGYRRENGRLPVGPETAPGFFAVDYDALKRKAPGIVSRLTNRTLPVLLHESGEALIDYGLDIVEAARRAGEGASLADGADAREWLVRASPLAPVRSYPYAWRNGEPQLVAPSAELPK